MGGNIDEIINHLDSIKQSISDLKPMPVDAMTYSELKMHLMVNYVANLSYYVALKQKGESVANHPVFKHLAYLRTFMERLAPLDASLKYQIDKLLLENPSNESDDDEASTANAGPNLKAFMPSVSSAVKRITVDQVKRTVEEGSVGPMEIDPMLIAAQIQKAQERAENAKSKRKVKTYIEADSEDERIDDFDEEKMASKKKAKKTKKTTQSKKVQDDDDEEIDSDEFDD